MAADYSQIEVHPCFGDSRCYGLVTAAAAVLLLVKPAQLNDSGLPLQCLLPRLLEGSCARMHSSFSVILLFVFENLPVDFMTEVGFGGTIA